MTQLIPLLNAIPPVRGPVGRPAPQTQFALRRPRLRPRHLPRPGPRSRHRARHRPPRHPTRHPTRHRAEYNRLLFVAAYWRTNLTLRQLAPLFGISRSAADRTIDHLGPKLAPSATQAIREGLLAHRGRNPATHPQPHAGQAVEELPLLHRRSGRHPRRHSSGRHRRQAAARQPQRLQGVGGTLAWKQANNRSHKQVRACVEHTFARMKGWNSSRLPPQGRPCCPRQGGPWSSGRRGTDQGHDRPARRPGPP